MIIGIHGKKRSGKDTTAKFIKNKIGGEIYSLATPIKQAISSVSGLSMDVLNGNSGIDRDKTKFDVSLDDLHSMVEWLHNKFDSLDDFEYEQAKIILSVYPDINSMTIRELMQTLGTDIMVSIRTDYWLNPLKKMSLNNIIIIPDIRQTHEIDFIRSVGIMVFVNKDTKMVDNHITERGLSPIGDEFIIDNNSSLNNLENQINTLIGTLKNV